MAAKVKVSIEKIEGQGVDIQRVVDGLRNLKAELQSLGCKVSVKVQGIEIEAGNGVRTRDLLLGNKGVRVEGENVATPQTDEPKVQYSEFALIGCAICGATGQELFGDICSNCFASGHGGYSDPGEWAEAMSKDDEVSE